MYLYFSFENLGNFLNSNIFIRKHLLLEAIFFYIFYIHQNITDARPEILQAHGVVFIRSGNPEQPARFPRSPTY